jgi:hypothetical protein
MHQDYIKGKKLLLIYKNGIKVIGKFRKSEKGILYFFDIEPVAMKKLRSASYYKPTN